jgi:hypothetical protein
MLANKVLLIKSTKKFKSVQQYQSQNQHWGYYKKDGICVLFKNEHIYPCVRIDLK